MEVTTDKLTAAVDGMEVVVDLIGRDYPPGAWVAAKIRYPGAFASAVLARLAGQPGAGPEAPDHAAEAVQALSASVWQRQQWGEGGSKDDLRSAAWELERAKVHALLGIEAALRELTAGERQPR